MDAKKDFDEKRNLIVNYLPSALSQDDVKLLFCRIGPVSNCKLIRNYETGQSLGYAFIEYPTEKLAIDAISQLDGLQMKDKKLKVSYARQSSPEIKNSNVYVAGLPAHTTEDQLYQLFSPFGKIITHKLLVNSDNTSRGVGFVRYALKSEAQNAIESMSGKHLDGGKFPITVKIAIPPVSKQQNALAIMHANSLVAGSSTVSNIIKGGIRYSPMTPSNQAVICPILNTSAGAINPGTASVTSFLSPSNTANQSVIMQNAALDQTVLPIYVFGLQAMHNELTLYELFAPFGAIVNVKIIRDLTKEDKPCKGFGFVNFRKSDEARDAVETMNGRQFEGRNLQVSFKQGRQVSAAMPAALHSPALATQLQSHSQNEHLHTTFQSYPQQLTGYKFAGYQLG